MRTSPPPDLHKPFAALMALSAVAAFAGVAVHDVLVARRLRRRPDPQPAARTDLTADRPYDTPGLPAGRRLRTAPRTASAHTLAY